jgi:hypothetical protein
MHDGRRRMDLRGDERRWREKRRGRWRRAG